MHKVNSLVQWVIKVLKHPATNPQMHMCSHASVVMLHT